MMALKTILARHVLDELALPVRASMINGESLHGIPRRNHRRLPGFAWKRPGRAPLVA